MSKIVELERCDGGYGCDIPWQMYSTTGDFKVSIYDGDRMSTNSIYVIVDEKDAIEEPVVNETYADRLMSHFSLRDVDRPDTFKIDGNTRVITPPASFDNFGVESDENTNRVWFEVPLYVGDGIDLSALNLYINYQNANGEKDKYIVEDASEMDGVLYFSWVLSRKATQYKGDITFIVCAIGTNDEGVIETEWNTTLCTGSVLEGLEVENPIVPIETVDLIDQLVSLAKNSVANVENAVAQAEADIEFARQQSVSDVTNAREGALHEIQSASDGAVERLENAGLSLFANALKGSASGNPLVITGISPITHEMTVTADVGNTEIMRTGKNLFNYKAWVEYCKNGGTRTDKAEESVNYLGEDCFSYANMPQDTSLRFKIDGDFLPNTQYTFTVEYTTNIDSGAYGLPAFLVHYTDGSNNYIQTVTNKDEFSKITFTTDAGKTVLGFRVASNNASTIVYVKKNMQIELGVESTEFESYAEPIVYETGDAGEVVKILSLYPTTVLSANNDATITAEYNRDINKVIANLESALASSTDV